MLEGVTAKQDKQPIKSKVALDWLHFVGRAEGSERGWVSSYREHALLADRAVEALRLLRKGKLEAGRDILSEYAVSLEKLQKIPRSVHCVLERWYQGTLGYYYYCTGELELARVCMSRADAAVVSAISLHRNLIPLASHCHEFRLHHARIARNGRQWAQMRQHIDEAEAMTEDRQPLCVLEDGEEIYCSSLARFYRGLGRLDEREEETVRDSWDLELRRRLFHRFVRRLLTQPDFAILYP